MVKARTIPSPPPALPIYFFTSHAPSILGNNPEAITCDVTQKQTGLKGPEHEILGSGIFSQIRPVSVYR
jgi:hypothetical protein